MDQQQREQREREGNCRNFFLVYVGNI